MKLFRYDKHYNFKKIYKEKMKDRHKINGIKFDYSKREVKKYLLSSNNEKSQEKLKKEHEENLLFQNYNKLKHQIFVREQKEKDISKIESNNKYSSNFNYTNIVKFMEKFLSLKNDKSKDNPFNYNLKKGKLVIENMNRNIKRNRIHASLKKIVLHFTKVKSKLETRINEDRKLYLSEEKAEKIKNKIQTQRQRLSSRNYARSNNNTNTILIESRLDNNKRKNSSLILIINKKKKPQIDISNFNESSINKSNINNNLKLSSFRSSNNININLRKNQNSSSMNFYSKVINSEDQKTKKENNSKYILINTEKFKKKNSYERSKESIIENDNKNFKNKKLALNSSGLTRFSNITLNTKKTNYGYKSSFEPSEMLTDDYNTIGSNLMKKYKNNYAKKNNLKKSSSNRPQSCIIPKNKTKYNFNESHINNKNFIRSSSSVKRKSYLKVIHKPLYTTNINDLIKEYDRIKKNIKKLKKNYEEKHFSTYKEIDHLLKIKEEMLMFLLKQKFFSSKFKPKPNKFNRSKKEFINKMKDYVEILEDKPKDLYTIDFEDFTF